ncbi:MAG: CBS domain-containing protein [Pseudomonadota bacterium]
MMYVHDLMTTGLLTLSPTDTLKDARALMAQAHIRHIPIIDEHGYLCGLVTHRDLLMASVSLFADVQANEQDEIDAGIPLHAVMLKDITTVDANSLLRDAAELLLNHKFGCLPVMQGDKLVGIVTEADFLKMAIRLLDAVTLH